MGKDSISTAAPLSEDALRPERHIDTTQVSPACTEFLECADGWAARGEWGLASVWYALAAASEDARISKQAWLAGFYSAMAMLVDHSLSLNSHEGIEAIRASCAIVTDGANTQEYVEKDHVEQRKKIDSASWEEGLAGLYLEEARAMLRTKKWRTFIPIVDTALGKAQSLEEKIEAHLIKVCYASLRPGKAKTSLLKSFGNAMHLKFGDTIAEPSPRGVKVDKLIESLASLFLEEGAGLDVSGKTDTRADNTIVDLLKAVDLKELLSAVQRRAGEMNYAQREETTVSFNKASIAGFHRLIFIENRKPTRGNVNKWLKVNRHKLGEENNSRKNEIVNAIQYFRDKFHATLVRVEVNEDGEEVATTPCTITTAKQREKKYGKRFVLRACGGERDRLESPKALPYMRLDLLR